MQIAVRSFELLIADREDETGAAGAASSIQNPKSEIQNRKVRTFICIDIPAALRERIESLQSELKRIGAQVSWVKPSNVHLTLKFLGDVPQKRIESVCASAERATATIRPFDIEVGGTGCFPSPRNARALWVGLTNATGTLKQLHAAIEDEFARDGFPRELKRFSPHLTIGRVRAPHYAGLLAEELIRKGFEAESFQAREIIVMRSDLRPTGSIYTPQAIIPFDE